MLLENLKIKEQQELKKFLQLLKLLKKDLDWCKKNDEDSEDIEEATYTLNLVEKIYQSWKEINLDEIVEKGFNELIENYNKFWESYIEKCKQEEVNTIFLSWGGIYNGSYTEANFCKYDYSGIEIYKFRYNHKNSSYLTPNQNLPFLNLSLLDYFTHELQDNAEYWDTWDTNDFDKITNLFETTNLIAFNSILSRFKDSGYLKKLNITEPLRVYINEHDTSKYQLIYDSSNQK